MEHDERGVRIYYTNWKGESSDRYIVPERLWYGSTEYHPTPQWLVDATDIEKGAMRTFSHNDIHVWEPMTERDWDELTNRRITEGSA